MHDVDDEHDDHERREIGVAEQDRKLIAWIMSCLRRADFAGSGVRRRFSRVRIRPAAPGLDARSWAGPYIARPPNRPPERARSSAGRAPRSQCGGQGFDPPRVHQALCGNELAATEE